MKDRYIGVTGITTKEHVELMTKILEGYLGMYGILMSPATLKGKTRAGRWANLNDIPRLMKLMPDSALRTIHWGDYGGCNNSKIEEAINSAQGQCNAIQLNLVYPPPEIFEILKCDYSLKTIFPIEKCMFEDPEIMKKKMQPYQGFVDYVIIDQSMGAGKLLNTEISEAVAEKIKGLGLGVVFAGGLNDVRVKRISDLVNKFNASVDAEGQLMKDFEDGLDMSEVENYLRAAVHVVHPKK